MNEIEKRQKKNEKNVVIFSAHGTNREILLEAQEKFKTIYNLECPLVTKIYNEINEFAKK
jgi:4-hydroxy-3-methylbut-2-enyl diphosphate reductase IspH